MTLDDLVVVDFETTAITGNPLLPQYTPRPVGVALSMPHQPPEYLAWAHPTGNNCTLQQARERLGQIARSGAPLLFHNAGFDISVWNTTFEPLNVEAWERYHDTMYLLFLADPYASTLSLKPSATRYLGTPPEEQAELHQWILENIPESTPKSAGAYISLAPGELVGRYAVGDVVRTGALFNLLYKRIIEDGMGPAYDRERRLFPVLYNGTRRGIRVDRDSLALAEKSYSDSLMQGRERLAALLGCGVAELDHTESFADALELSGAVTSWVRTKTGKRSLSKDNLTIAIPAVKELMDYTGALSTCLQTFIRPWLVFSESDGRLHPNWNQVRQAYGDRGNKGTQTGRLSSDTPNFQNVPTEFVDATGAPLATPEGLLHLPRLRRFCLPEDGHVWLKRDFSSQEIRILAHFEDGGLCEAYKTDPNLDPHEMARQLVNNLIGVLYSRKSIKITGFSIIYGSGARGLSGQLGSTYDEANQIKNSYLAAMPDVRDLMYEVQRRGRSGGYIRTWGGRIYYTEPSKVIEGQLREFSYKLLNYLIQGSAADQTKQSIIDWEAMRDPNNIFLATVHDEINISVPIDYWHEGMLELREAMNADRLDVPMLSEGFVGPNWADLEACE